MATFACLILGLMLPSAGCRKAQSFPRSSGKPKISREEKDALYLVQGHSKNGHVNQELKRQVLQALRAIRAQHPEARQLHAYGRHTLDHMLVFLDKGREAIAVRHMKRDDKNLPYLVRQRSGIESLDGLVRRYGGRYCQTGLDDTSILGVLFPRPMDMRTLQKEFDALPGIGSSPNMSMGDGNDIVFKPRGDKWHFVFKRGWDHMDICPTKEHYHYYTYEPESGTVVKNGELPTKMRWSGIIYLWGVPYRRSVKPFASWQDLRAKAAHKDWWVRLHAVDVLGFLLTNPKNTRMGEDDHPKGHFEKLRDDVRGNRQDALKSLRKALLDTDKEVRRTATKALPEIMVRADVGLRAKILHIPSSTLIPVDCGMLVGVREGDVFEIRREGEKLGRAKAINVWKDSAGLRPLDRFTWTHGDDVVLVELAPKAADGKEKQ